MGGGGGLTIMFVILWFSCARLTPQQMSPTQYARTVRCSDEVLCMVRYRTVRYGTVRYRYRYGTVLYCTVKLSCTVPYRTENLKIMERREADPI